MTEVSYFEQINFKNGHFKGELIKICLHLFFKIIFFISLLSISNTPSKIFRLNIPLHIFYVNELKKNFHKKTPIWEFK